MDFEQRKAKAGLIGRNLRGRVSVANLELRDVDDSLVLSGCASVTNAPYDMGWYTERIAQGAFSKTLSENPDVQLLVNHEGLPLARTLSGTLRLHETPVGLMVDATLDPGDPDVDRVVRKMRRGDIDQMSFAFRAINQYWNDDYDERTITEVAIDRGDVSVVNQGANPATFVSVGPASLRAYAAALVEVRSGATLSAATLDTLQGVLDLVAQADDAVDEAQVVLSELMEVPNPDDVEDGDDDSDDSSAEAQESEELAAKKFDASAARDALRKHRLLLNS